MRTTETRPVAPAICRLRSASAAAISPSLAYSRKLALGSLAGAGSFGLLIPPSVPLIVYGVQAETSISRLFLAGVVPGLLLATTYAAYIATHVWLHPDEAVREPRASGREMLRGLVDLLPVSIMILAIIGGIYSGLATPSEAAALGLVATVVIAFPQLSFSLLSDAVIRTLLTSSMVLSLIAASSFLTAALGYLHLPQELSRAIIGMGLNPYLLLLAVTVMFVILGTFMEGLSMMLMTLPFVLPIITEAGFDPIWFGVYMIIMIELGAMTPPVGLNLFVISSVTREKVGLISRAALPFFVLTCLVLLLLSVFPQIVLLLPNLL